MGPLLSFIHLISATATVISAFNAEIRQFNLRRRRLGPWGRTTGHGRWRSSRGHQCPEQRISFLGCESALALSPPSQYENEGRSDMLDEQIGRNLGPSFCATLTRRLHLVGNHRDDRLAK